MGAFATGSFSNGGSDITGSGTAGQVAVFASTHSIESPTIPFTSGATGFTIGSLVAEPAGVLTLSSTTQGFIPPRLTTPQRASMPEVLVGMMIFNSSQDTINIYTSGGGVPTWASVITSSIMPATFAVGDILYASTTGVLSRLASVDVGSYLRSGGTNTAPLWSTLKLPNSATAKRVVYATSSNTYGESANMTFDGNQLLIGGSAAVVSTDVANFFRNQNASTSIWCLNNTNNTAAQAGYFVSADNASTSGSVRMLSSSFTPSGPLIGGSFAIVTNSSVGMQLGTVSNTGILLWTNNTNIGRFTSTGRLGIGVDPTALIHLKAGTSSANTAPLKFTSGTNLTTAEAGAMEYNGADLFFTKSGTTRGNVIVATAVTTETVVSDTTLTVTYNGTTYKMLVKA